MATWKTDKKMQQHHDGPKGFTEFSSQDEGTQKWLRIVSNGVFFTGSGPAVSDS